MHVVVTEVRYAAGLPGRQVVRAECLCGWTAVTAAEDPDDADRLIADHLGGR